MSSRLPVSPRTDAAPMAFTIGEFVRGALLAWMWFLVFSMLAHLPVAGLLVFFVLFSIGPWSVAALLVGSPLAYALGRGLSHNPSLRLHAALFALFGAVIGTTTTAIALSAAWTGLQGSTFYSIGAVCVAATVAVLLGWWQTARRALRRDREALSSADRMDQTTHPFR